MVSVATMYISGRRVDFARLFVLCVGLVRHSYLVYYLSFVLDLVLITEKMELCTLNVVYVHCDTSMDFLVTIYLLIYVRTEYIVLGLSCLPACPLRC